MTPTSTPLLKSLHLSPPWSPTFLAGALRVTARARRALVAPRPTAQRAARPTLSEMARNACKRAPPGCTRVLALVSHATAHAQLARAGASHNAPAAPRTFPSCTAASALAPALRRTTRPRPQHARPVTPRAPLAAAPPLRRASPAPPRHPTLPAAPASARAVIHSRRAPARKSTNARPARTTASTPTTAATLRARSAAHARPATRATASRAGT